MARLVGSSVKCEHEATREPGAEGKCYKCHEAIMGAGWVRDPKGERELLGRVTQDDALASSVYRQVIARCGEADPWDSVAARDFVREGREEILDFIAYLFGQADQRRIHGYEDDLSAGQLMALHHAVECYRCLHTDDE